jgi:hypothetical protein
MRWIVCEKCENKHDRLEGPCRTCLPTKFVRSEAIDCVNCVYVSSRNRPCEDCIGTNFERKEDND